VSDDVNGAEIVPQSGAAAKLMSWLERVYDQIVDGGLGIPAMDSKRPPVDQADAGREIRKAVRYATIEAGGVGFITSVGGLITLPVSLPAGMAGTLLIQMRMVVQIAHLRGYHLRDPAVRTTVLISLIGMSISDALKGTGVIVAGKFAQSALKKVPGSILLKINKWVGFRLLTKFGEKGVINLGKLVPLAGGPVGAAVDAASTRAVARIAKHNLPFDERSDDQAEAQPEHVPA